KRRSDGATKGPCRGTWQRARRARWMPPARLGRIAIRPYKNSEASDPLRRSVALCPLRLMEQPRIGDRLALDARAGDVDDRGGAPPDHPRCREAGSRVGSLLLQVLRAGVGEGDHPLMGAGTQRDRPLAAAVPRLAEVPLDAVDVQPKVV